MLGVCCAVQGMLVFVQTIEDTSSLNTCTHMIRIQFTSQSYQLFKPALSLFQVSILHQLPPLGFYHKY